MIARVQDSSMTSWLDHLPSGNQKTIHRAERIRPDLQAGKA